MWFTSTEILCKSHDFVPDHTSYFVRLLTGVMKINTYIQLYIHTYIHTHTYIHDIYMHTYIPDLKTQNDPYV